MRRSLSCGWGSLTLHALSSSRLSHIEIRRRRRTLVKQTSIEITPASMQTGKSEANLGSSCGEELDISRSQSSSLPATATGLLNEESNAAALAAEPSTAQSMHTNRDRPSLITLQRVQSFADLMHGEEVVGTQILLPL